MLLTKTWLDIKNLQASVDNSRQGTRHAGKARKNPNGGVDGFFGGVQAPAHKSGIFSVCSKGKASFTGRGPQDW